MTRIAASRKRVISRRHEIRFLLVLTIGLCVPLLSTVIAIVATTEPDISDLTPAFQPGPRPARLLVYRQHEIGSSIRPRLDVQSMTA